MTMGLCGVQKIAELGPGLIRRRDLAAAPDPATALRGA